MKRASATLKVMDRRLCAAILCLVVLLMLPSFCCAEEPAGNLPQLSTETIPLRPTILTLTGAIELARRNYPAIRTSQLRADAQREGIKQAKIAYLPAVALLLDENYGTANNVTGFLAPQLVVPNISGLVKNKNNFLGGFGFTTGALISWEPLDFGLRKAQVNTARSATTQAQSQVAVTQLQVMTTAADAFLQALAARQAVRAAQAQVDRWNVFYETVHVLAQRELKALTDEYLAQAELVRAKDQLIAANQNYKIAIATLIESVGIDAESVELEPGNLLAELPESHFSVANFSLHPQAMAQKATIELAQAKNQALDRTFYPRLFLRVPLYARGTSFEPDLSLNFGRGYYPTTFNYAISALVTFNPTDIFLLRSQRRAELKTISAEQSRYEEIMLNLKAQDARARAFIEGAVLTAQNAPIKVHASTEAANSARIRYQHQLASINDVAQNEQLLTQSQVEYATAQLQVWRALLAAAVARGDLTPFVQQVSRVNKERR